MAIIKKPDEGRMNDKNKKQNQKPETSKLAKLSLRCVLISICLFILFCCLILMDANDYFGEYSECFVFSIFVAWPLASFVGLVLGIVALRKIKISDLPLARSRRAIIAIVLSATVLLIFILGLIAPTFTPYRPPPQLHCQVHIRNIRTAIIVYAEENNGRLPKSDTWCDLLKPYVYNPDESFVCPETKKEQCSYSFNMNVSGMKLDEIPPDVVLLFESKPGWNRVGGPELLNVNNHDGKGCSVSFANGQQDFIKTEHIDTLRWEP